MSMVTIEDALKQINNRFKLIQVAAKRARKISVYGSHALVDWDKNTPIIVALREIACGYKFDDKGNYVFKDITGSKIEKSKDLTDSFNSEYSEPFDLKINLYSKNTVFDFNDVSSNNLIGFGLIEQETSDDVKIDLFDETILS